MAISAFVRIGFLHRFPHMFGQLQPFCLELLGCIDGSYDFVEQLVRRLDLADELSCPFPGDMTIGTDDSNAGSIGVVNGAFVFLINKLIHLVTRDAKFQGVGVFHERVESAPEDDAGKPAGNKNGAEAILGGWRPEPFPQMSNHVASLCARNDPRLRNDTGVDVTLIVSSAMS